MTPGAEGDVSKQLYLKRKPWFLVLLRAGRLWNPPRRAWDPVGNVCNVVHRHACWQNTHTYKIT